MTERLEAPNRIHFAWLVRLRWGAIVCQVITVVVVDRITHIAVLPLTALGLVIGLAALTNVGCELVRRSALDIAAWHLAAVMALDVVLLTALLFLSGGPFNPFSFLYLVEIALAAIVLQPRWTWLLVLLALAASAFLFVDHRSLHLSARTHDEHMSLHLWGMWVAFGVAAAFIVYFLLRVSRALAARDAQLEQVRRVAERQERLASLATLAAGAGHELSTPLGTIAVASRELERMIAAGTSPDRLAEDAALIRREVARCRTILDRMSAHAGESTGEAMVSASVPEIVNAALEGLPGSERVERRLEDVADRELVLPRRAVAQAVRVLVENAVQLGGAVEVRATSHADRVRIEVTDRGGGMPPEVLAHAGEPFFTTKPPGQGMGLGLFLARAVAEQLGGSLVLDSRAGEGTRATLDLPVTAAAQAATIHRIATPEAGGTG